jgi:uncharacterized membrane protein
VQIERLKANPMKKSKNCKNAAKTNNTIFAWASLTVAALLAVMVGSAIFAVCFQGTDKIEQVKAVNGTVTIPLQEVSDGKAHFYRFASAKKEIVFFVVRGSDGIYHTAFDACEVCCFRKKKGYMQQGYYMICLGCRERYAINMIGQVNGIGCKPHHLVHSEEGEMIIIKVADLKAGAHFF